MLAIAALHAQDNMATIIEHAKKNYNYGSAVTGEKCVTIKAPEGCWKYLLDENSAASAVTWLANAGRGLAVFAKYMGWSDVADESPSWGDNDKKKFIENEVDGFKNKVSLVMDAGDMPCNEENCKLMERYAITVPEYMTELQDYSSTWKPKSGEMHVRVVMSGTIKDIQVTTDGKNFTVTAPWKAEPNEWDTKIKSGLKKGGN